MRKRTAFQLTKIRSDTNIKITQHIHLVLHTGPLFNLGPLQNGLFLKNWSKFDHQIAIMDFRILDTN